MKKYQVRNPSSNDLLVDVADVMIDEYLVDVHRP